ncbi:hypothetical protein [Candidatus Chloroploca asiatica]|nr:hypothetical protein [Candidatus Chloroploca asiatica]
MSIVLAKIPINEASQITGLDEAIIRHLINSGAVAGSRDLCDLDEIEQVADKLLMARSAVDGHGILATDAATKYRFTNQVIYKWIDAGWVRVLIDRERNKLLNEPDIAAARVLADLVGQAQGRSVFPPKPRSGRPRKNPN